MSRVIARARLRPRSQLTLPDAIVQADGVRTGDDFVVEYETSDPGTIVLRRVRESYAGALDGVYGDVKTYLEEEREAWDRT
jgi:hypothetical protein